MIVAYLILLAVFSLYSYAFIDPNLTLFNNSAWAWFREQMVYLGYYQRPTSWFLFVFFVVLLFLFQYFLMKKYKSVPVIKLTIGISIILLFAYPFLSHDLFNYMFDARIFTLYGKNPYVFKALDFQGDQWIRFMHWTHRTYPYGPVFLLVSFIPSFLGVGKFILTFFLFKLMFVVCYAGSVLILHKMNRKWALFFAIHPLILIEGVMNSHNDLMAVFLTLFGLYYIFQKNKKGFLARILLIASMGIKFITAPFIFITNGQKKITRSINILIIIFQLVVLIYLSVSRDIQPWYFLTLFVFIPLGGMDNINRLWPCMIGLLGSYYPYIYLGGVDNPQVMWLKHTIIIVSLVITAGIFVPVLIAKKKHGKSFYNI